MKLGINIKNLTWPLFRAWWSGMWFGVMLGLYVVAWFGHVSWLDTHLLAWIIPMGCLFMAIIPDMVAQVIQGVRRYRGAAKRRPYP